LLLRERRQVARPAFALALALVSAGCANYGSAIERVEHQLAAGKPTAARERLEAIDLAERDAALEALHRGMVARMAGDREASIAAFERALEIMGELQAVSLTETAGSLVISENVRSFEGAIYERILVHVFQALNYLERGDDEAARVEARRIDLGLRRIDNALGRAPHGGDAFARYLAGLIYEAAGELDDARIAYRKAWQAYRGGDDERPTPPAPTHLGERLARVAAETGVDPDVEGLPEAPAEPAQERGEGHLFIVVYDGLVPARVNSSIWLQIPSQGELMRFSVPALRARASRLDAARVAAEPVDRKGLSADAGYGAEAATVEDVAAVARASLSAQIAALTTRSVARNVVRHQITHEVREKSPLLGALVNVFGVLMEEADTRSWRTLPARIRVAHLAVVPGTYEVSVGGNGAVLPDLEPVTVDAGELVVRSVHRLPRDPSPVRR